MEQEQVQIAEPSESLPSDVALEDFIQHHIFHPKSIKRELDKLPAKTVRSYHYGPYNNLFYCIVKNLVAQKHASSFDNLIEKYKPFLCNNIEKKNRKIPVANPCLPKLKRILSNLGENIKLARLRRQWSAQMLGDRAGCTRYTIAAVESGAENVAIGVYLNILFVFGFEKELEGVAQKDPVGRLILDARMLSGRAK